MAKILIVDDKPATLDVLQTILVQIGKHEVVTADGGLAAIKEFEAAHNEGKPVELLILDQEMPLLSGTDVAAIIRQREVERHSDRAPVRIAILSAYLSPKADNPVLSEDVTRLGIGACMAKPFEMDVLLHDITELLAA